MSVFNGKTDLARLNPRHAGAEDLTEFLINDEKYLKKIAKNLGMKASEHHWDLDFNQFNKVIADLAPIIRANAKVGKMTFVYF